MISKTFCVLIATLLIIGSADIAPAHQGGDDDSQVIFYNGKIFTNDNAHKDRAAKFVGVKEGHVVVVGDDLKDLFKHIKKDTEFVNLFGRTLVPGTIDRHDRFDIDNIKGQIKKGACADFLILSSNPFNADDEKVNVEAIVIKGAVVLEDPSKQEANSRNNKQDREKKDHKREVNVELNNKAKGENENKDEDKNRKERDQKKTKARRESEKKAEDKNKQERKQKQSKARHENEKKADDSKKQDKNEKQTKARRENGSKGDNLREQNDSKKVKHDTDKKESDDKHRDKTAPHAP